jgi:poly(rC)-binding protein 3/4
MNLVCKLLEIHFLFLFNIHGTNDMKSSGTEAILLLQGKINDEDKDTAVMLLLVPKKNISCLIGKGGSIINDMRRRSNADIHITKDDPKRANSPPDELVQVPLLLLFFLSSFHFC